MSAIYKKIIIFGLILICTGSISALAELVLEGKVVSQSATVVRAPFGGMIEKINVREGDLVSIGDPVVSIITNKFYAPQDGVIGSVCAQEGDNIADIIKRYGAIVYIEPINRFTVLASTEKAFNSSETKYIHIGEILYLSCIKDGSHQGTARVVQIEAADENGITEYVLEVIGGDFYIGETVGVFRNPNYESQTRVGRGIVTQANAISVEGTGSVLKIHVSPGDYVERGQLLFETVEGTLDGLYAGDSTVWSETEGIVAKVDVQNGTEVDKNDNLIVVYPFEELQIEALINILDVATICEGAQVEIEFDVDGENLCRYTGNIENVSYISGDADNQRFYSVYISFEADEHIRLGMPAIVYIARTTDH